MPVRRTLLDRIRVVFGVAYGLPISWQREQIEALYQNSLSPFIKSFYKTKQLSAVLYIPGQLLAWIDTHHPEYIQVIRELLGEKRIELLSGGYYDPLFPLLSHSDAVEQIERTSTQISRLFKWRPRGIWFNHLVWEQKYASILASCGLEYTFLRDSDDVQRKRTTDTGGGRFTFSRNSEHANEVKSIRRHLNLMPSHYRRRARLGHEHENDDTPVMTECNGRPLVVYPLNTRLFDLWYSTQRPRKVLVALKELHRSQMFSRRKLVSLIDDTAIHTGKQVIEKWLTLLQQAEPWLETICPHNAHKESLPLARRYFHTPQVPITKPLADNYSQQSRLYAKTQMVHTMVKQMRGDKQRKRLAYDLLLQSQNRYTYLNSQHLPVDNLLQQKRAYTLLLEAERIAAELQDIRNTIATADIDYDGLNEYIFQSRVMTGTVHRRGGALVELSHLQTYNALLDTISADNAPEDRDKTSVLNRLNLRSCFVDHILTDTTSPYQFLHDQKSSNNLRDVIYHSPQVNLERATVELQSSWETTTSTIDAIIDLVKKYRFQKDTVSVDYQVHNNSHTLLKAYFASQINVSLTVDSFDKLIIRCRSASDGKITRYDTTTRPRLRLADINTVTLEVPRKRLRVEIGCHDAKELWVFIFPKYKLITLLPRWRLYLGSLETYNVRTNITLRDRERKRTELDRK